MHNIPRLKLEITKLGTDYSYNYNILFDSNKKR